METLITLQKILAMPIQESQQKTKNLFHQAAMEAEDPRSTLQIQRALPLSIPIKCHTKEKILIQMPKTIKMDRKPDQNPILALLIFNVNYFENF